MVNIIELAHVVDLLVRESSPVIVNRALRAAGIDQKVLKEGLGFLPYRLEAIILEYVARAIGDQRLGARIAQQFDYSAYNAYARYVLGGKDLREAVMRAQQALPFVNSGSEIVLRKCEEYLLVGRRSGLDTVVGHQHLDDGAIIVIGHVIQHFLGPDWRPARIDVTGKEADHVSYFEDITGVSVRDGAEMPTVAVLLADLDTPNPRPPEPHEIISLADLPVAMRVKPPKTTEDLVWNALPIQMTIGDLSQDGVAQQLSMGPRTLQRALQSEGTSFREVKAQFIENRARLLLSETDLSVKKVARFLGYEEPKSFIRAFGNWTSLTPNVYRTTAGRM